VAADVFDTVVYPGFDPVTMTEIRFPFCVVVGLNVFDVAFGIVLPSARHWYFRVTPEVHEPAFAVRVDPTRGVPEMVGVADETAGPPPRQARRPPLAPRPGLRSATGRVS